MPLVDDPDEPARRHGERYAPFRHGRHAAERLRIQIPGRRLAEPEMVRRVLGQVVHDVAEPGIRARVAELGHEHGVPRVELPPDGRHVGPDHRVLLAQPGRGVAPEPESVEGPELGRRAGPPRRVRRRARHVHRARGREERHMRAKGSGQGEPRHGAAPRGGQATLLESLPEPHEGPADQEIAGRQHREQIAVAGPDAPRRRPRAPAASTARRTRRGRGPGRVGPGPATAPTSEPAGRHRARRGRPRPDPRGSGSSLRPGGWWRGPSTRRARRLATR